MNTEPTNKEFIERVAELNKTFNLEQSTIFAIVEFKDQIDFNKSIDTDIKFNDNTSTANTVDVFLENIKTHINQ